MQKLDVKSSADFLALTEEQKSDFKKLKDKQEADLADLSTLHPPPPASLSVTSILESRNEAEIHALRLAQEEDLRKKALQLAARYVHSVEHNLRSPAIRSSFFLPRRGWTPLIMNDHSKFSSFRPSPSIK